MTVQGLPLLQLGGLLVQSAQGILQLASQVKDLGWDVLNVLWLRFRGRSSALLYFQLVLQLLHFITELCNLCVPLQQPAISILKVELERLNESEVGIE